VSWFIATIFGAVGGLVVSAVAFFHDIWAWHEERRLHLRRRMADMPGLSQFTDPKADTLVLMTRMTIGALTGYLVHNEVTGVIPVIAAGASAHAILSQFGRNASFTPGLEVGTDSGATLETYDGPGDDAVTKELTSYQARHAKGDAPPGPFLRAVPRPRVQPDKNQFTPGELE
jgi:hypothetical protein